MQPARSPWAPAFLVAAMVGAGAAQAQENVDPGAGETVDAGAAAGDPVPPPGVRVAARVLTGVWLPADRWATAVFDLRNDSSDSVEAECAVEPEAGSTSARARTPVSLPPRSRKRVFLPWWPGRDLEFQLAVDFPRQPGHGFAVCPPLSRPTEAHLVGVLTDGAWLGPQEPGEDVIRVRLRAGDLPDRVEALDGFDCIHWIDPAPGAIAPAAARNLAQWVKLGGHLLVETAEPGRLTGLLAGELPIPAATAVVANRIELSPDRAETGRRGFPALVLADDGWSAVARTEHGLAAAIGPVELGRLGILGVRGGPDVPLGRVLYRRMLCLPDRPTDRAEGRTFWGGTVYHELSYFPITGFPGISVLVGWVLLYIAVVGPLETWALRRIRRPTWTWWVFPAAIALFSAILWTTSGAADVRPVRARCVQCFDAASGGALARVLVHGAAFYPDAALAVARIADPDAELGPRILPDWSDLDPGRMPATAQEDGVTVTQPLGGGRAAFVFGRWTASGRWIELRVEDFYPAPPSTLWHIQGVNRSPYDWGVGVLMYRGWEAAVPAVKAGAPFDVWAKATDGNGRTRRPAGPRPRLPRWLDDACDPRGRTAWDHSPADDPAAIFLAPILGAPPCPLEFSGAPAWEERLDFVRCRVEVER